MSPESVRDAMIVAGGAGSRLRPLTDTTPKPLLPFCGAPFLEGVVRRLASADVMRVFLVVGAWTAPFEEFGRRMRAVGVDVRVVAEPEPLDTAGGVRLAERHVDGPYLVLNGDVLTDADLREVCASHVERRADATIVLTRVPDTSAFGVCLLEGTRVTGFVEKPAPGTLPGHDTVNAGTYVLEPGTLQRFDDGPLSFERTVFPALVAGGARVEGVVTDAGWADLGTPERMLAGQRMVLSGGLCWPGVRCGEGSGSAGSRHHEAVVSPDARIVEPVVLCAGAHVGAHARVGPDVVVGEDAVVGSGVAIADSVLFPGARVDSPARALIAGHGAVIEAGVELGELVVLGDGARVVSGSRVGPGSRVPREPDLLPPDGDG